MFPGRQSDIRREQGENGWTALQQLLRQAFKPRVLRDAAVSGKPHLPIERRQGCVRTHFRRRTRRAVDTGRRPERHLCGGEVRVSPREILGHCPCTASASRKGRGCCGGPGAGLIRVRRLGLAPGSFASRTGPKRHAAAAFRLDSWDRGKERVHIGSPGFLQSIANSHGVLTKDQFRDDPPPDPSYG